MEVITISGLDRITADELQGLLDESGEAGRVDLKVLTPAPGHAGDLTPIIATISEYGPHIALLLTAWIVSKKNFDFEFTRSNGKSGETKSLKIKYRQEGPKSVLTALRDFLGIGKGG